MSGFWVNPAPVEYEDSNRMIIARLATLLLLLGVLCGCGSSAPADDPSQYPEATLEEVNQALATWFTYQASYPSNIQELAGAPFFKRKLPTPPPGKKLVVDQRRGVALYVNE